jgi:phosphohistidine phosphatase
MRLYLMRHATSGSEGDPGQPADADPPLSPSGMSKARAAARGLLELRIELSFVLSSPLARAMQTAEIVAQTLSVPVSQLRSIDALRPESAPAALIDELARLEAEELLCVGHGPQLDDVVAALLGCSSRITALKKAAVVGLQCESLSPPRGVLLWLYPQRGLRRMGR